MNDKRKLELAIYNLNTAMELLNDIGMHENKLNVGSCMFTQVNIGFDRLLNGIRNELVLKLEGDEGV